ncbi:MAG: response regulator transcription factor [Tissierellia bacterium]|jgi:two-component system alkaline phosphatase synthesis response regulator PhoP|nr:response regulator transcription factor [Bacillota bacterium]NLK58250.1 response regulator transcription factor [Tissierellia bacterium]
MHTIYIVEDEENIREMIAYALNNSSFKAMAFADAKQLYAQLDENVPSLFLLDIMLEGEDGYTILETLRENEKTKDIPIIMLTAKSSEFDKVKGLDMGADDFITKPFGVMELISRVKAVLRRVPVKEEEESILRLGGIVMDLERRLTFVNDETVELTYKEFELLYYLLINKDIVLTRSKLMTEIWGFAFQGESRTVDVHIRSLRQKLKDEGKMIQTVRNVGYKIGE